MRSRIIGFFATLVLLLALSTTAIAGDLVSEIVVSFPDDPGIPTGGE